jgi:uncharacterized membrane protein YdjX (TVP38/TMEM64 family)
MAPGTVIYVNFGRQLGTVTSLQDLLSPGVLVALTGLGLLALTPALYRQWTKRQSGSIEKSEA